MGPPLRLFFDKGLVMNLPRRKVIRLPGYDYSTAGFYFLTICTQNQMCLFGEIRNGEMQQNDAGEMVQKWWFKLDQKFPEVVLHEQTLMPNHIHGIIQIEHIDQRAATEQYTDADHIAHENVSTIASMMQWFKTMSMNDYIRGVKRQGWRRFPQKMWQRSYYEHIIRDEEAHNEITEYIRTNPQHWGKDKYHR